MTKAERWRRYWGKSTTYDAEMGYWDRRLFGDSRAWACGQATGEVLEVAVGTGLNLPSYPAGVTLTGVDLSEGMLAIARDRARRLGHPVTLREGDAEALPFAEASFDTVLCTFGLCAIPDPAAAVGEMVRVLRPGGRGDPGRPRRLVFPGRAGPAAAGRAGERPLAGEHFRRRPLELVEALGLPVQRRERFKLGLVAGKIS